MSNNSERPVRLIGIDIFRVTAVLFVFLFHSNMHYDCYYGPINKLVIMGAIFMTGFFILSGYALFYTYSNKDLRKFDNIKDFIIKRFIGIIPLYYSMAIIITAIYNKETLLQGILLFPVELLGIQTLFYGLFGYSHNGGTWFVSCILICYVFFPYIQEIVKQASVKHKVIIIAFSSVVLLWSPIVEGYFNLGSIYSNPAFRLLEFTIGIVICSLKNDLESCEKLKFLFTWPAVAVECIVL